MNWSQNQDVGGWCHYYLTFQYIEVLPIEGENLSKYNLYLFILVFNIEC